jgi:hypothetical protein
LITPTKKEMNMDTNDVKEVKDADVVNAPADPAPAEVLAEAQVSEVAGGAGDCSTNYVIGVGGSSVSGPVPGGNFISGGYEGAVQGASYVIERVARAIKSL